ncbi:MAG: restriction endonuclease [Syntrophomonas sp.]
MDGEINTGAHVLVNIIFHYPPELMSLLIDTIPLLNRSKKDVLLFFYGAGVSESLLTDIRQQLKLDPNSINKFEITRKVLTRLNEKGEATLRERREILKRVIEFESFSTCWDNDRLKAKGLVAEIRDTVNVKDSFTRMKLERDMEKKKYMAESQQKAEAQRMEREKLKRIKDDFAALFLEKDPHKRGKKSEAVLNALFEAQGILVREAFTIKLDSIGVVEQIDGVIQLDGEIYLVEMKWYQNKLGPAEVGQHLVRVFNRGDVRGMIISSAGFTSAAVQQCKEALVQKTIVLCDLEEYFFALEQEKDLLGMLREKVKSAMIDKNPYLRF